MTNRLKLFGITYLVEEIKWTFFSWSEMAEWEKGCPQMYNDTWSWEHKRKDTKEGITNQLCFAKGGLKQKIIIKKHVTTVDRRNPAPVHVQ